MNWQLEHWTNLGMFVAVLLFTGLGTVTSWDAIPTYITPGSVSTFALAVLTFIKTMYTAKPRDPNIGERRSDPNRTVPVVGVTTTSGKTVIVPAAVENPGRPIDDQKPPDA